MGLRDTNLSAGFMSNTYGAASTLDEQEIIRLRSTQGGRVDIEDAYDRTGNMRVAKTLAHYQKGGKLRELKGPDDYYTQPEIDEMTDEQFEQAFPEQGAVPSLPEEFYTNAPPVAGPTSITPSSDRSSKAPSLPEEFYSNTPQAAGSPVAQSPRASSTLANQDPTVNPLRPYETIAPLDDAQMDADILAGVDTSRSSAERFDDLWKDESTKGDSNWWQSNQGDVTRGLRNISSGLLNIAPNIANMQAYRDMGNVRPSRLQRSYNVDAPSMEAGRQAIIAQGRTAANEASSLSPQGNVAQRAAALASTQSALSRYAGQEAQVEAKYDAVNMQMRAEVDMANIGLMNEDMRLQEARNMFKMRGMAQERTALTQKTLGFMGDLDQQKLDKERMGLTRQRYNTYEQMDRAIYERWLETGEVPEGFVFPSQRRNESD